MKQQIPKWLSSYDNRNISLNCPQYHFYIGEQMRYNSMTVYPYTSITDEIKQLKIYLQPPQFQHPKLLLKDSSKLKQFQSLVNLQKQIDKIVVNNESLKRSSQWIKKYEPTQYYDLLTEQIQNRNTVAWLKSWDGITFGKKKLQQLQRVQQLPNMFKRSAPVEQNYKRPLLLAGPPGCGKTTLARVVAHHCGYATHQINASDDRTGKALLLKVQSLTQNHTLNAKPVCIIVDEVDGAMDSDEHGLKTLLSYMERGQKKNKDATSNQSQLKRPIIFICNDPFVKGLKELRSKAIVMYFNTLQEDKVVKRLKEVTSKENQFVETDVLTSICKSCNNDIRNALGVVQLVCSQKNAHNISIKQAYSRMNFSFSKDSSQKISQFLSTLMQPAKKTKQANIISSYASFVRQCQNQNLLYQQFFHNILNNNSFLRKIDLSCKLYDELVRLDVGNKSAFRDQYQSQSIAHLPLVYYKLNFKHDEYKKVQFPTIFFQRISKKKQNEQIVLKFVSNLPCLIRSSVSRNSVIRDYIPSLCKLMQTCSVREEDALVCLGTMIAYNVRLAHRNANYVFNPQIDALAGHNPVNPKAELSYHARTLIEDHYDFVKMKCTMVQGIHPQRISAHINKNKRKYRNATAGTIKYKYLQGSGNQVNYQIKIGYFFKQL